ncbi:hypothetical protein [Trichothermofontia sp.]
MQRKLFVWIGIGLASIALTVALLYGLVNPIQRLGQGEVTISPQIAFATTPCITIVADPNPPLNVRSTLGTRSENTVVGTLANGTVLVVDAEAEGWLHLKAPVTGWVYQELTAVVCQTPIVPAQPSLPATPDLGTLIWAGAREQYQAGRLEDAIAILKSIPPDSPAYGRIEDTVTQWRREWRQAETQFSRVQQAFEQGDWSTVLMTVEQMPAIRFWRGKLTPIVMTAIARQQAATPLIPPPQPLVFPEQQRSISISGFFAGTEPRSYVIQATQGQQLRVETAGTTPLPQLFAPDGTLLTSPSDLAQSAWTVRLPQTGAYRLELSRDRSPYAYAYVISLDPSNTP